MYCRKCGYKIQKRNGRCPQCGEPVETAEYCGGFWGLVGEEKKEPAAAFSHEMSGEVTEEETPRLQFSPDYDSEEQEEVPHHKAYVPGKPKQEQTASPDRRDPAGGCDRAGRSSGPGFRTGDRAEKKNCCS